ncbi:hypothetical protein GCM10011390_06480 [Aureimonas endophytica]|uniref:Uncharacterized protein n=1 Tax=Aureimonas endophytica TaxID=2027858 RepID=A0A916ZDQ6_9HYPH|nr:hypothetical protein [Aureimonas endophytica]GGD90436.1 hypothetical protein GCM10011390_06480 [Aureimonas endophytica]
MVPSQPFSPRRRLSLALLAAILAAGASPAGAQDASGKGGLFGFGSIGGAGPGGERESGAYVSPSAIPDGPSSDLGVTLPRPLQKLEPIALPDPQQRGPLGPAGLGLPNLPAYAPQNLPSLSPMRAKVLHLEAKLAEDGGNVPSGLVWRLFAPVPGADGKLPLIATAKGGGADFAVPAGSYLLHVGFGHAGVTRRVDFNGEPKREQVVLSAGGLKLHAMVGGDKPIAPDKLNFSIYSDEADERDRRLIADDVAAGATVALNAGAYRIVSKYGDDNAEVGGEVKVEAGKITDVTLQHRAAELTMKLVREKGGEAIADTAWQVMDANGALIRESVGAFPSMVLAEGEYLVVAKNRDKTYQRDFTVTAGLDADVELKTSDVLPQQDSTEGSGD